MRELAGLLEWLRLGTGRRPAPPPHPEAIAPGVPTVQVRYYARRTYPYVIRLDRALWLQAGSPRWLAVDRAPDGWRVVATHEAAPRRHFVDEDRRGPFIYAKEDSLLGLAEGVYVAELIEQVIAIREALGGGGPAE